ncbi:MAG TPA: hypothetical protein VKZ53_08620 [Candidatus Angelobacter sp.]|nr:hypothetical protein [Candidatus Angelobacter sp.]
MRLNVNLASRPYQDAREFYIRWGSALGAALLVTLLLGILAWHNYSSEKKSGKVIRDMEGQLATMAQEKSQVEAIINRPENRDVRDQSHFWNTVIAQKSFSWTHLFSDLEKIMPNRAYVKSVQPTAATSQRLRLKLVIAGEKHDDAIDLIRHMEQSERFRFPLLKTERTETQGSKAQPVFVFDIETDYTPAGSAEPPHAASMEGI